MATTSNMCAMHDQEPRGRSWTRRRGHQARGTRRRATEEAPATGRPVGTGRPTSEDPPDDRPGPDDRQSRTRAKRADVRQVPDVRPSLEIRRHVNRAKTPDVRQVPDDRTLVSHRTSGTRQTSDACLCTVYRAEPMYPFALTYPFVALDYIYSSTSTI